jgi:hypothetical protein
MPNLSYFLTDLIALCAAEGPEAGQVSNMLATSGEGMVNSNALREHQRFGRTEEQGVA